MLVTAAVVSVVLVVDDATTASPGDFAHSTPPATATPTATPTETSLLTMGETAVPVPHRDALGVIQTTAVAGRTVALTFDDGPSPKYTAQVLDILDEHEIKATFCVVGTSVEAHPELVREIADRGHTLCDHTLTHDLHLGERGEQRIRTEIGTTLEHIQAAVPGVEVPFYRAPGGNFSAAVNAVAGSYGQQPLGWSVDPRDWADRSADTIRATILDEVTPGSIVLLHDGGGDQSESVTALKKVIVALHDADFDFVIPAM
jgi:peptidoglycan/xylan/chitin deacetylase (PgdA/CDA1 family)